MGRIFSEILEHARCRAYKLPKPYLGISCISLIFLIFNFFFFWLPEIWLVEVKKKQQNLFQCNFLIIVTISVLLIIDVIMSIRASNPLDLPTVKQAQEQELELNQEFLQ